MPNQIPPNYQNYNQDPNNTGGLNYQNGYPQNYANYQENVDYPSQPQPQIQQKKGLKKIWNKFIHHTLGLELSLTEKFSIWIFSFLLFLSFIVGYFVQIPVEQDEQKFSDMQKIMQALDSYYLNSSTIKEKRFYPSATCSLNLNEIDFEYTLRYNLLGLNKGTDIHEYISPEEYPRDAKGKYESSLEERSLPPKCPDSIPDAAYEDIDQVCDFSAREDCYLYTSTPRADGYKLAYYSRKEKSFVIFEKFRDREISVYLRSSI